MRPISFSPVSKTFNLCDIFFSSLDVLDQQPLAFESDTLPTALGGTVFMATILVLCLSVHYRFKNFTAPELVGWLFWA